MVFVVIILAIPIIVALFALAGWLLEILAIAIVAFFGLLAEISTKLALAVFIGIIALLVYLTVTGTVSWGDLFWSIMDKIGEGIGFVIQKFLHAKFR